MSDIDLLQQSLEAATTARHECSFRTLDLQVAFRRFAEVSADLDSLERLPADEVMLFLTHRLSCLERVSASIDEAIFWHSRHRARMVALRETLTR